MEHNLCVLVIFPYFCIIGVFSSNIKVKESDIAVPGLGDPLLLTPLLDKGDYKTAQLQSRVKPDLGNVTSFSGFLTVNETCGSNLFFWFFPAEKAEWKDAPLVLWVQVGRLSTVFEAIGPFKASEDGMEKREYFWNRDNNLLFIEQPGKGYSYSTKHCYPEDVYAVGEDLYQAVVQIHKLFPELQGNKFFIAGEMFAAGRYIPALGHKIHTKNPSAEIKINLSAMMIGNGWMDTVLQSDFGNFLYQHGLIDTVGKEQYDRFYGECKKYMKADNWTGSFRYCRGLYSDLYFKHVGVVEKYNYISRRDNNDDLYGKYLELTETRQAIHVGNLTVQSGYYASEALKWDYFRSVKNLVEELLEEYPIIFYNGQLDIVCGYPMMINFLRSLSWSGQDKYLSSERSKWCIAKNVQAGYFTGSHHLYDVLVLGAGYRVSRDQPHLAFQLLSSITSGTKDNPLHGLTDCGYVKVKLD